jgi:hypothetical protein
MAPERPPRLDQLVNESENSTRKNDPEENSPREEKEQWDPDGIQIDAKFHVSQTSA